MYVDSDADSSIEGKSFNTEPVPSIVLPSIVSKAESKNVHEATTANEGATKNTSIKMIENSNLIDSNITNEKVYGKIDETTLGNTAVGKKN